MQMKKALRCGAKLLELTTPCTMGIINMTPDSFSDGGQFFAVDKAMQQAAAMVEAGAKIIDIGGESTRPGAQPVSLDDERKRVLPVVNAVKHQFPNVVISVDTSKPDLMADAIEAGCEFINDVNALRAPGAIDVVANSDVAVCLMHMLGKPRTMQQHPQYNSVVQDVYTFLRQRVETCISAGIARDRLVVDPGFGFGKSLEHNILLLKHLREFKELGVALLVGVSRKSMIGTILDKPVDKRLIGSVTLAAMALLRGTDIIRVHDVEATMDVLKIINAVESV